MGMRRDEWWETYLGILLTFAPVSTPKISVKIRMNSWLFSSGAPLNFSISLG